MVQEIIVISIGQAGVQMSNACWEIMGIEHAIDGSGDLLISEKADSSMKCFYNQSSSGKYVPRTIFVDLEPTVIDEIRTGCFRDCFHPSQLLNSSEDASNNFARGHYTVGKSMIDKTIDQVRKIVDNCSHLQGFIVNHSTGGGTGSGFTGLVLERLAIEFAKKTKICISVTPSPQLATATVEPYNNHFSTHTMLHHVDLSILMDNEAIYDLCSKNVSIQRPIYTHLNRLIAQVFSNMTLSVRYESMICADMNNLCTNLVPYPRIHFPITKFSPFTSHAKATHETLSTADITRDLFDHNSLMVKCNPDEGKYMSCCIMYRGDINPNNVNKAILDLKKKSEVQFVDWCPTGFKIGINRQMPCVSPRSCLAPCSRSALMITNSTAITQPMDKAQTKFKYLYGKRAFVHHYVGEGMEEGEFDEARETVQAIILDYEEAAKATEIEPVEEIAEQEIPEANEGYEGEEAAEGYEGEEAAEGYEAEEVAEGYEAEEIGEGNEMGEAAEMEEIGEGEEMGEAVEIAEADEMEEF